ncbi:MAG: hypothetical protein ACXWCC_03860 [Caldimonas sp.]
MRPATRAAAPPAPGREAYAARPFAVDCADLAVRVDASRPVGSTDFLLAACLRDAAGQAPQAEAVRHWTVARRLDALVAIRQAGGARTERVVRRCAEPGCGESFEVEIELGACRNPGEASSVEFSVAGNAVRARLPTGADQARWQAERTPLQLVAASLLETQAPPDETVVAALDAALADADPARELQLDLTCPACATTRRHVVDLEAQLLGSFAGKQGRWLRQIARLAQAFHWPEAEIARMPQWRRDFYLARLDGDAVGEAAP